MKKYGVRELKTETNPKPYVYYAEWAEWASRCQDEDKKFGTDDINDAYRFMAKYNCTYLEVFEKDNP